MGLAGNTLDDRKVGLRRYFGEDGFERWRKIYSNERVSYIRRTVREGHNAMASTALAWAWEQGSQLKVLDAGCGPGLVSRALARAGSEVTGCDLAEQMVEHACRMASLEPPEVGSRLQYIVSDLETVSTKVHGPFDVIFCLDVLIYYPEDQFGNIIQQLVTLQPKRIIFTYAPASTMFKALHRVGRLFPQGHRSTRMEIIGEAAIRRGLGSAGMKLARQQHFSKGFYHVVLAEAIRE